MQRNEYEHTEIALPENEAHYWELFENASDFVYTCDMQGHLTSANKAGTRLLNRSTRDSYTRCHGNTDIARLRVLSVCQSCVA
jgi:PAS domain-containing protein